MMKLIGPLLLLLGLAGMAAAQATGYTYIAGYEPQSDVTEHAKIDVDVKDIIGSLPDYNGGNTGDGSVAWTTEELGQIATAKDIYQNGKNSAKTSGMRSLAGFSTAVASKTSGYGLAMVDEPYIKVANDYWTAKLGVDAWGDAIITAAMDGTVIGDMDFGAIGNDFRIETIQKGIPYFNALPYVVWEMQDAINDCNEGDHRNNGDAVHAWDEAVAFFTGSLEGPLDGGDSEQDTSQAGYMHHYLGDKRCQNYHTCINGKYGVSKVNKVVMTKFQDGERLIQSENDCTTVVAVKDEITTAFKIPLVQGLIRYLYKVESKETAKEGGELFAFGTAIIPYVHECSTEMAEALYALVWKQTPSMGFATWKSHLEMLYPCMGLTCADIGTLQEAVDAGYESAAECTDGGDEPEPETEPEPEPEPEGGEDDDSAIAASSVAAAVAASVAAALL